MKRRLGFAFITLILAVLAACDQFAPTYTGIDLTGVDWGRDFRLTDADGRERTLADFRGKYVMVFFGYIYCPVVCPTVLLTAAEALKALGPDAKRVQVLVFTLDPERDTAAQLKEYAASFDSSFIGLWGDAARMKEVAKEFRVFYQKVPAGNSYTIDHTAFTYVFDPRGHLRLALRHQQPPKEYAADLRKLMQSNLDM